jgi:hypothetical protein
VADKNPEVIAQIKASVEKHRASVKEAPSQLVGSMEAR